MELQITGHNIELTDALRDTVKAKSAKLPQFFDKINNVQFFSKSKKGLKLRKRRFK